MPDKKKNLHHRLHFKYRLSILDEGTWNERWHIRLNAIGVIIWAAVMFVLTMAVFSLLILYTPLRNYLPGYSENIRQQLIEESVRVDSLRTTLDMQCRYLDVVKQIMAGKVVPDSIQNLDSMQIIMRAKLLEAKSEVTEDFLAQFEAKGKDNLLLFDVYNTSPATTFFRPLSGTITKRFDADTRQYGLEISVLKKQNIVSVASGTVVNVQLEFSALYSVMVQHEGYLSIYRNVGNIVKAIGDYVQAGEVIGVTHEQYPMVLEIWQNGTAINPEDIIAW